LALSGIFPLAGFYSKDLILEAAFGHHAYIIWAILWITAGLTAFYSFRLVMYVFYGEKNFEKFGYHPHEAQWYVIAAMVPLAILAISAGWSEHSFVHMVTHILPQMEEHVEHSTLQILLVITSGIAIAGIAFAVFKFKGSNRYFGHILKDRFCYKLLANQYYLPKLIDSSILKPYLALSKFSWKELDVKLIDAIVDSIAKGIYDGGEASKAMQSGNLSKALKWMGIGIVILLILVLAFNNLK
jgi:NADH-quinone oxidoreductase subunit L